MVTYQFTMEGTAADDQTWSTSGKVLVNNEGEFPDALDLAQRESFMQLTGGRAVFGKPGIGCRGPYKITKFLIERSTS